MREKRQKAVLDAVRCTWEQGARSRVCSTMPGRLRIAAAILLSVIGSSAFIAGLLGNKEHSDNIAYASTHVVPPQGSESQEWGGGVHDAHGASARQAGTTMNCSPFQGVAP